MNLRIGFLGAGHMGSAIIQGLTNEENPHKTDITILATCHSEAHAEALSKRFGVDCRTDNEWLCKAADVIILGVKPQQMQTVLQEMQSIDLSNKIIITIAAALHIDDYRHYLGDEATIVRAMPNVAASVQASLTGLYCDTDLSDTQNEYIEYIFQAIGDIAWLDDETQIDGITALSGSGIAYFFRFMQAMAKAGEQYGFEPDQIYDIVSLTALGAASLILDSGDETTHFGKWVKDVAVEGGTTAQAINVMEQFNIDTMVDGAMNAVINKSQNLRETLTQDWT